MVMTMAVRDLRTLRVIVVEPAYLVPLNGAQRHAVLDTDPGPDLLLQMPPRSCVAES